MIVTPTVSFGDIPAATAIVSRWTTSLPPSGGAIGIGTAGTDRINELRGIQSSVNKGRRISICLQDSGLADFGIRNPDSATPDHPAVVVMPQETPWAPGEAELRTKVIPVRLIEVAALHNFQIREGIDSLAQNDVAEAVVLVMERSEILPPQPHGQGQTGTHFPVILSEDGIVAHSDIFRIGGE